MAEEDGEDNSCSCGTAACVLFISSVICAVIFSILFFTTLILISSCKSDDSEETDAWYASSEMSRKH